MKRSLLALTITAATFQAAHAAPFMPMDARGLAMGNTGVATAKLAHAPAYNPSLLAQSRTKDHFALLLPQVGVMAGDPEQLVDKAEDITDIYFPAFDDALEDGLEDNLDFLMDKAEALSDQLSDFSSGSGNLNDVINKKEEFEAALDDINQSLTKTDIAAKDLTRALNSASGNPLNARLGVAGGIAIPSKKFAAAVSIQGTGDISARINVKEADTNLFNAYVDASKELSETATDLVSSINNLQDLDDGDARNEAAIIKSNAEDFKNFTSSPINGITIFKNGELDEDDPSLSSTIQFVAVGVVDVGLTFAREFHILNRKVALGITPKIQKISTYHFVSEVDGFEDFEIDDITDNNLDYSKFNMDIGASYRFGSNDQYIVGLAVKNLLGGTYKYADHKYNIFKLDDAGDLAVVDTETIAGESISLKPQVRAGVGYTTKWINLAADFDLTENKPLAFEAPTQYAAIGAELDVLRFLQLRVGYRTNIAKGGTDVVSAGLGLRILGQHVDVTGMANPSDWRKEAGAVVETGFYF